MSLRHVFGPAGSADWGGLVLFSQVRVLVPRRSLSACARRRRMAEGRRVWVASRGWERPVLTAPRGRGAGWGRGGECAVGHDGRNRPTLTAPPGAGGRRRRSNASPVTGLVCAWPRRRWRSRTGCRRTGREGLGASRGPARAVIDPGQSSRAVGRAQAQQRGAALGRPRVGSAGGAWPCDLAQATSAIADWLPDGVCGRAGGLARRRRLCQGHRRPEPPPCLEP